MKFSKNAKAIHVEEDSEGTWALSYGDMITLLLSFFVIFFTTDFKSQKIESSNHHLSFELEELKLNPKGQAQEVQIGDLGNVDIKVHQVDQNILVTFGNISFFNSGSTHVNEKGIAILSQFTEKYLPYAGKYQLSIKGFTDKNPVKKAKRKFQDNLELSVLRAVSAMRHLQKAGLPLNRMEIAGVGELKAIEKIIPKANELNKSQLDALSRTVVLVIKPEKESWP